ncbi:D-glycero-beta-D-manno-heptose 1-phosphate adenylyltransferase [Goodfellowiella coeruleoviolacea]|uniref:Bifunctional protein HldE n=1 Tax=Goodfellowiella coeruleoviolacea TaxID=334858 RepID=A0AAE3GA90_9PSEU|nr:D-glycero-beta-D-manno-heptose 1-phosphate adenylyltransferase [Goodfellowiella coeruleoviolacea]MCP2163734.1 rfaE bifunctional protein, domain I/rfaE bifunctional protein, domain II [Goodfellowiella coeruleoviolacea]
MAVPAIEHDGQRLTDELPRRLAGRHLRVAVVGDAIVDGWLSGRCQRLCREAPAPVVDITERSFTLGGAANTAANLAALGARVRLVSAVGADPPGESLLREAEQADVDTTGTVVHPARATVAKYRVCAGGQVLLRFDEGVDQPPLDRAATAELVRRLREAVADCDAVLVCDYGTGVLGGAVRAALRRLRERLPLLVVDAHEPGDWAELAPDVVTPNAEEAASVLGTAIGGDSAQRLATLERHRDDLFAATGASTVVVTLDRDGAALLSRDHPTHRTWARPVPDHHTAGAGDTFVAALTVAAGTGLPLTTSVELAQAAADVVVHRPGTAVCDTEQLAHRLGSYRDAPVAHGQLADLVAEHRTAGRRIVFTNGCFDVLHRGHVAYLNQAKQLGDVLVVAVNDDTSVARLKGPDRPVNTAADRAAVLAALSCVDHVTVFDEDTPVDLLRRLRPDVYAKGGDYTPEMLPETPVVREFGGEVRILDYVPDHSTSAVIDRIRTTPAAATPGRTR